MVPFSQVFSVIFGLMKFGIFMIIVTVGNFKGIIFWYVFYFLQLGF